MSDFLAEAVKAHFLDSLLEETHEYFSLFRVKSTGVSEVDFLDQVKGEAEAAFARVQHRLQLGPAEIRRVGVDRHELTSKVVSRDPMTGEIREEVQTWHEFKITFHCSGRPFRAPLAVARARFDDWLLVDRTEYLEIGEHIDTPAGVRTVVSIDTKHNMVKLNASAGGACFPIEPTRG